MLLICTASSIIHPRMHKVNTFMQNNSSLLHLYSSRIYHHSFLCILNIKRRFYVFKAFSKDLTELLRRFTCCIFSFTQTNICTVCEYLCVNREYIPLWFRSLLISPLLTSRDINDTIIQIFKENEKLPFEENAHRVLRRYNDSTFHSGRLPRIRHRRYPKRYILCRQ